MARRLAGLGHDKVEYPIDMFEHEQSYYQAFELLEGYDLKTYMEEQLASPPSEKDLGFLDVTAKVFLFLLSELHAAGIVHCDLKIDNLFLGRLDASAFGKKIKLIDFDFSFFEGTEPPWVPYDEGEDKPGYVGTLGYQSPEHLTDSVPTQKSDVFTASVILYQLYTGRHPLYKLYASKSWDDPAQAARDILEGFQNGNFESPMELFPESPYVNPTMSEALVRSLSMDPDKRPTAQELHQALVDAPPTGSGGGSGGGSSPGAVAGTGTGGGGAAGLSTKAAKDTQLHLLIPGKSGYYPAESGEVLGQANLRMFPEFEYVDAQQFKLEQDPGDHRWYVEGLPSQNNTRLNGDVVTGKRVALTEGDKITVGKFTAIVNLV